MLVRLLAAVNHMVKLEPKIQDSPLARGKLTDEEERRAVNLSWKRIQAPTDISSTRDLMFNIQYERKYG